MKDNPLVQPFEHMVFDIDVSRNASAKDLRWPKSEEVGPESNPGCNQRYADMRGLSWKEAKQVLKLEQSLISRIEQAEDMEEECRIISDELYEGVLDGDDLLGLDIGIASTVAALSASGGIPITSCNGGCFGGQHYEDHPLVGLYIRATAMPALEIVAAKAEIGFYIDSGILVVYTNDIRKMINFASIIIAEKCNFREPRHPQKTKAIAATLPLFEL